MAIIGCLSEPTGHSRTVNVLELVPGPRLANGIVVYCGRFEVPAHERGRLNPADSRRIRIEADSNGNKRSGDIWIVDVTGAEATFCGRLT